MSSSEQWLTIAEIYGDQGPVSDVEAIDRARAAELIKRDTEHRENDPLLRLSPEEAAEVDAHVRSCGRMAYVSAVAATGVRRRPNGQAIAKADYDGNLGGGSPKNPLRIGEIVHK